MNLWIQFWTFFLITGLILFAGLSIAVSIGGLLDLRALFRKLKRTHEPGNDEIEPQS